jgi:fatty-acyl-CoA synthase
MGRFTIGDALVRTARRYPERTAFVFRDAQLTFRELNERASRFANAMAGLGVSKGDRVALISHNCLQYLICLFGLSKMGVVFTPLNFMLKAEEIRFIINHSETKVFIVEDSLVDEVKPIVGEMPSVKHYSYIKLTGKPAPDKWLDIDELYSEKYPETEPEVEIDQNDPFALMYTSGTEAAPKGVLLSHLNYYSAIMSLTYDFEMGKHDTVSLMAIPAYHVAGMDSMLSSVINGNKTIMMYAPDLLGMLEIIQKERVSGIALPPTVWGGLLQWPDIKKYDFSSLEGCISFGGFTPQPVMEQWAKLAPDVKFRNYYGLTEITSLGTTLQPEDVMRKTESIGKPCTNVALRIVDDEDKDVKVGEVGEIVARSPGVMLGYYKEEEKTREAFRSGWLHTGDLARMDEEGYFYFVDRKKDMVKSGAENVSSQEVEGVLYRHPKLAEAAVIGLPHPYWMEAVTAVVVPKKGVEVTEEEIIQHCKSQLAGYKVPKKVLFLDELPKNPSGKILKRELREEHKESYKE